MGDAEILCKFKFCEEDDDNGDDSDDNYIINE